MKDRWWLAAWRPRGCLAHPQFEQKRNAKRERIFPSDFGRRIAQPSQRVLRFRVASVEKRRHHVTCSGKHFGTHGRTTGGNAAGR
jgi:hypothetical protein